MHLSLPLALSLLRSNSSYSHGMGRKAEESERPHIGSCSSPEPARYLKPARMQAGGGGDSADHRGPRADRAAAGCARWLRGRAPLLGRPARSRGAHRRRGHRPARLHAGTQAPVLSPLLLQLLQQALRLRMPCRSWLMLPGTEEGGLGGPCGWDPRRSPVQPGIALLVAGRRGAHSRTIPS